MREKIKSITVVGAGTAGLIAALMIKKKIPDIDVSIIKSSDIGIIGVGEGSTEHWLDFMKFVDISYHDVIKECDATFKSGIMFKNWGNPDYLQSIGSVFNYRHKKIPFVLAHQVAHGASPRKMVSEHAWESKVNTWFIDQNDTGPASQFHFDTHKLNNFLIKTALSRGIDIVDDEIVDVKLTERGIQNIVGKYHSSYISDFYIDCTGFTKALIVKLGAKWNSHSKYLKMKSSIVFPTEQDEFIPMYTTATAMNNGWMFNIPTYGRYGNGYVFDSDYISADQAKQEVEKHLKKEIEIKKVLKFDPGALDNSWIKNCLAVGLSSSFVEPLEASSIGTSIQQIFLFLDLFSNYDEYSIKKYNKLLSGITDNIRDFIALHYITGRDDSEFWKAVGNSEIPDSLAEKLDLWRNHIPTTDDFVGISDYRLFTDLHHILVLHGLNLFDVSTIKKEYDRLLPEDIKQEAKILVNDQENMRCMTIPHKIMLDVFRNIKKENYDQ